MLPSRKEVVAVLRRSGSGRGGFGIQTASSKAKKLQKCLKVIDLSIGRISEIAGKFSANGRSEVMFPARVLERERGKSVCINE